MGFFYSVFRLLFGTLYPAYASYKAVRTKNVKEYVKWMMYWIVFALFTCAETFTDLFLSFWFPFYYEIKIVLVLWLLSPATKGSSILYRNFVHPALTKREQEIDEYISKAKEQGYHTMLQLGSKGVTYATNVIMQTAIKNIPIGDSQDLKTLTPQDQHDAPPHMPVLPSGDSMDVAEFSDDSRPPSPSPHNKVPPPTSPAHNTRSRRGRPRTGGGGLVNHIRRSYSLSDLTDDIDIKSDLNRNSKLHGDNIDSADPRDSRRTPRKAVGSHVDLYFPEMDVDIRSHPHELPVSLSQIRSSEDISSGYSSSGEGHVMEGGNPLMRTASVGGARTRGRGARNTAPSTKKPLTEEGEDFMDDFGWQHALPPFPLATMYPHLVNLDSSALPQRAFLTPETLHMILSNSLLTGGNQLSAHIYETVEDKNADASNIKDNSEQHKTPKEEYIYNGDGEENGKFSQVKDKYENFDVITSELKESSIIEDDQVLNTETNKVKENIDHQQRTLAENVKKEQEQPTQDGTEQNECFEDACDDLLLPLLKSQEIILDKKGLNGSMSNESLASSDDQCFEDSIPDIETLSNPESPSMIERKGKYNKVRAPAPPAELKDTLGEIYFSDIESSSALSKPDALIHSNYQSTYSQLLLEENQNLATKRDSSPSPSLKIKKDFTRFLPKTSLFNFFGAKEETHYKHTSPTLSRSPSNVSVKSAQLHPSSSFTAPTTISNIEYTPDDSERISRKDVNTSSPKLRLREMSQSPSRKRHYEFE